MFKTPIKAKKKKGGDVVEKETTSRIIDGLGGTSWSTLNPEGETKVDREEEEEDDDDGSRSGRSSDSDSKDGDDSPLANKLVLDEKLKKRFATLYTQRTHGTAQFRKEFIRKYKDLECDRCASLSLKCVTVNWERHIPCDECGKTRLTCSRMNLFRRELIMKGMGINKMTFDAYFKDYQENLEGKEGAALVGSDGKPERDELVSSEVEGEKIGRILGDNKRKNEDEERVSKKKRPKVSSSHQKLVPEVLISTRGDTSQKDRGKECGEGKIKPNAPRDPVIGTAVLSKDGEENGGDDDGDEDEVMTPKNVPGTTGSISQKRQRYPTEKAQYANQTKQRNRSNTRSPVRPTGSSVPAKAVFQQAQTVPRTVPFLPAPLPMQVNDLTATPVSFASTLNSPLNQNRRSIPNLTPVSTRAELRLHAIPKELSLATIKRQLEDVSSDLRYDRISVEETLKRFDEIGVRIRKRIDFLEKESG